MDMRKKLLHPEGDWALSRLLRTVGTAPNLTELRRVWTMLSGHHSGLVLCRARSWTSAILVRPFQLRIFYGSVKY